MNLQTDVVLGPRLLFGWKPRWIIAPYWAWLRKPDAPGSGWLRASGYLWLLFMFCGVLSAAPMTLILKASANAVLASVASIFGLQLAVFVVSLYSACRGRIAKYHFSRHVLSHQGFVCFECGYILDGLPPEHRCPECSTPYEIEELRRRWLEWMRKPFARSVKRGHKLRQ